MITIVHLITGLELGGAERMLAQVVGRADRSRFRPVVVSLTRPGPVGAAIAEGGISVRSLGLRRGMPDPRGIVRLAAILRELHPAVLQTWLYHADLLGVLARWFAPAGRLIWSVRCSDMAGSHALCRILARLSAVPDCVAVNSAAGQRAHMAMGYRPRRWRLIPNGFDTELFRPDDETRRRGRTGLGIPEEAVAVLLPARVHPMKDHGNFLAAAARLAARHPATWFALAGSGADPGNRALAGAIAANSLTGRLRLLGEQADMAALYNAFDIVTLSSAYGEGFPNVLGEAMACGVPCVATDVGDAAAIVADCGVSVRPRDPAALAAGWESLIALGRDGRMALGQRARRHIVAHYDLAQAVGHFEALYQEIVGT
jgi:glycosyltransferase involved in cell wall biosynthesis